MSFIYYFLFGSLILCSYLEFFSNRKLGKPLYFSLVILMSLTAGLSYAMSPDWIAYYETFYYMKNIDWSEIPRWSYLSGMEAGYLRLNKLVSTLGFGYGMLTLLVASVSLYLKSSTFYKYGGYAFLVLFIYAMPNFMFEEHVHVRQGLANAIAIFSVRYIIDRKLLKFLLCITIGYQFHESIVVFLVAYWITPIKFNEKIMGWLVVLSIVGFYTGLTSIIEVIMQFMPIGQDKFESYQNQLGADGGVAVGDFVKIISVLSIIIYNKYAEQDKIYCYFRNLFIFGVLLYFFLGKGIFGIRLPGFYTVFLGFTIGRLLYSFSGNPFKKSFIYYSFIFYTVVLLFWFQLKQANNLKFNDYTTFLSSDSIYGIWK